MSDNRGGPGQCQSSGGDDAPRAKKARVRRAIDPRSFYGNDYQLGRVKGEQSLHSKADRSSRSARVEAYVNDFLARLKERAMSKQRDVLYTQWNTQQEAFEYADREDPEGEYVRIFSQEVESKSNTQGQPLRKFLATSYVELWRRYKDVPTKFRHFYEIIREGCPCHAYFDLEYGVADNPGTDGEKTVEAFLHLLRKVLLANLEMKLDDRWIIELDSSSPQKFSRHIIVRLPGSAFLDNSHVGTFAAAIVEEAARNRERSKFSNMMFVKNKHGQETTFIDMGVYSRNRAFRLFRSSKAGKSQALMPTARMMRVWEHNFPDEKIFMHSLVGNVDPNARLLTLAVQAEDGGGVGRIGTTVFSFAKAGPGRQRAGNAGRASNVQHGTSPYPALERFVLDVCKQNAASGRNATIRSWASVGDSVLIFNLAGYRYCGSVEREHKSNGVFFVVDTSERVWYQKCYDPDCARYRSPANSLPDDVVL